MSEIRETLCFVRVSSSSFSVSGPVMFSITEFKDYRVAFVSQPSRSMSFRGTRSFQTISKVHVTVFWHRMPWASVSYKHCTIGLLLFQPSLNHLLNLKGHRVFGNDTSPSIVQVFNMFWCGCIGDLFFKCLLNCGLTYSFWCGCPFASRATAVLKRKTKGWQCILNS